MYTLGTHSLNQKKHEYVLLPKKKPKESTKYRYPLCTHTVITAL